MGQARPPSREDTRLVTVIHSQKNERWKVLFSGKLPKILICDVGVEAGAWAAPPVPPKVVWTWVRKSLDTVPGERKEESGLGVAASKELGEGLGDLRKGAGTPCPQTPMAFRSRESSSKPVPWQRLERPVLPQGRPWGSSPPPHSLTHSAIPRSLVDVGGVMP